MKMSKDEFSGYMRVRHAERRKEALRLFGGKCFWCGSDSQLQFDHKNNKDKVDTMSNLWRHSWSTIWKELKKCQLLCSSCHKLKSKPELSEASRNYARLNRPTPMVEVDCIVCGKKVFKKVWRLRQNPITTCSRRCSSERGRILVGRLSAKARHGTLSSYKYCGPPKCFLCRKVKSDWQKEWRERQRESKH